MRIKFVADDEVVLRCKTDSDILHSAFEPHKEPLAEMFGDDIYTRKVLLSLEDSNYIDSSGVGWLLQCHRRFRKAGGSLVLYSVPPLAKQLLATLKLDKLFHLASDAAAAREQAMTET